MCVAAVVIAIGESFTHAFMPMGASVHPENLPWTGPAGVTV